MILKFTNQERTAATFDGASFTLAAPEDWDSIGDGPTRERVKAWLAEGNEPELADLPDPNDAILAQIAAIESATGVPRVTREMMLTYAEDLAQRTAERMTAEGQPTTPEELLAQNIAYVRTKAVDDQIRQLRSMLK